MVGVEITFGGKRPLGDFYFSPRRHGGCISRGYYLSHPFVFLSRHAHTVDVSRRFRIELFLRSMMINPLASNVVLHVIMWPYAKVYNVLDISCDL